MDNTDTLLECGLGFTCDFDKQEGFIGQEHVLAQKAFTKAQGGLTKRMASVLVDDPVPLLYHGEVLWRNGERISDIRSASYGHTLGGAVGLTMLESTSSPLQRTISKAANGKSKLPTSDTHAVCPLLHFTIQRIPKLKYRLSVSLLATFLTLPMVLVWLESVALLFQQHEKSR